LGLGILLSEFLKQGQYLQIIPISRLTDEFGGWPYEIHNQEAKVHEKLNVAVLSSHQNRFLQNQY